MFEYDTTIHLLGVTLYRCPKCYNIPHIGYNKKADANERFLCGCPLHKKLFSAPNIEEAAHRWNMHVVETDEDIADMEGLQ